MNQVFADQLGKNVEVYIDDMIVKSVDMAVHIRDLEQTFETALPFFKLLRKEVQYGWTSECEAAFQEIKRQLASPPVLAKPRELETLILYLSVGDVAVSSALVQENEEGQQPIYFVSRLLQGAELRYQRLEKVAFALLISARRLRAYFQGHRILVQSDLPIRQILHKPDLAGRMMSWAVELSEFDIAFESCKAIKSQALADFVRELTSIQHTDSSSPDTWTVYVDGSSNPKGSGAGVIIENPDGVAIEYSMQMDFETSNNQAEYEAFIAGLLQAKELGARKVKVYSDSQLVTSQIEGSYQVRGPLLTKHLEDAKQIMTNFEKVEVSHIPRNENSRADILSKLASTKRWGNYRTVIEQSISEPTCIMQITQVSDWRYPIIEYIEKRILPAEKEEAKKLVRDEASYTMHVGGKALARKALRAGYFWPSMTNDAKEHVQKCDQCQKHGRNLLAPPEELNLITAPWPFFKRGIDLLGPFAAAEGQLKWLVVAVDYFTKGIEAEPVATITLARI
ncbi:uncharacterized protein LOC133296954 [Gastrolobium bilobum]|uniref:uncharacterized protein LOC133296954 n=1 Tax=Gastrolobium bilobum TaxID=150636 RepID=UPI002AAF5BED|nr:uncharacterized protein LOC133296954 [Gastrolobium bilobum]